jgi:hypothetical protein
VFVGSSARLTAIAQSEASKVVAVALHTLDVN